MARVWVLLGGLDGREIASPSAAQLAAVLSPVYAIKTVAGDGAAVFLRFGYDAGLMYQIKVGAGDAVRFEEWLDRDAEVALASPKCLSGLTRDEALRLWTWLAERQVAKIRAKPWREAR